MLETMKERARRGVDALLEAGADKTRAQVSYTITHEFNVDGGSFSLFRTLLDKQLSLTALQGGRRGVVAQNRYDDATICQAAQSCLQAAASAAPDENWDFAPLSRNQDFHLGAPEPDLELLFGRCRELLEEIAARFPKILVEQMIVSHRQTFSAHANSYGVLFGACRGSYAVELMFSAHEGDKASSFFGSGVVTDSLTQPFLSLGSLEKDLADVERQIKTQPVTGKFEGTLVLTPGCLASLLYSLVNSFAGEDGLLSGTSPWKNRLGEQVADERISLSLSPLDARIVNGSRITAEGFLAENCPLLEQGRLRSFALGLYAANKLGLPRGKNDSMNLVMAPGAQRLEEILASVDRGILVGRFSGGRPASNGDFSGVAKNSFLIQGGKLGPALSETMISGNLARMLTALRGLSREQVADGETVLPYAAFDGVTISGRQ